MCKPGCKSNNTNPRSTSTGLTATTNQGIHQPLNRGTKGAKPPVRHPQEGDLLTSLQNIDVQLILLQGQRRKLQQQLQRAKRRRERDRLKELRLALQKLDVSLCVAKQRVAALVQQPECTSL